MWYGNSHFFTHLLVTQHQPVDNRSNIMKYIFKENFQEGLLTTGLSLHAERVVRPYALAFKYFYRVLCQGCQGLGGRTSHHPRSPWYEACSTTQSHTCWHDSPTQHVGTSRWRYLALAGPEWLWKIRGATSVQPHESSFDLKAFFNPGTGKLSFQLHCLFLVLCHDLVCLLNQKWCPKAFQQLVWQDHK